MLSLPKSPPLLALNNVTNLVCLAQGSLRELHHEINEREENSSIQIMKRKRKLFWGI